MTINSPCNEYIELKPPYGDVGQNVMLSDFPGSKSQRPEEEKEWTGSWGAIDLHSVMFNSLTPAGLGSLYTEYWSSINCRAPANCAFGSSAHQKRDGVRSLISSKRDLFKHPPSCLCLSDGSATWLMIAADYWCSVYDLHAVRHIRKPIFISP